MLFFCLKNKRFIRDYSIPALFFRTFLFSLFFILSSFILNGCSGRSENPSNIVIARVDDKEITEDRFIEYYSDKDILTLPPNVKRKLLLNMIVDILVSEAMVGEEKEELDTVLSVLGSEDNRDIDPDVIDRISKICVINRKLKEKIDLNVTDEETEKYYMSHQDSFFSKESVLVSQILLKEKEDARKVYAEINKDKNKFDEFAAIYNTDVYRAKYGSLGWVERGDLPPELENLIFKQRVNRISKPIQTSFGFHIFWVKKKVSSKFIPLEEAREDIRKEILKTKIDDEYERLIADLIKKREIFINEEYIYK